MAGAPRTVAGSVWDRADCETAARRMREGAVIGTYARGVCVMWIDGRNRTAVDAVYRIKGEARQGRPFGSTLATRTLVGMIDGERIAEPVRSLLLDPAEVIDRLASLCLLRVPIRAEAAAGLPECLVSRDASGTSWFQNWPPEGGEPYAGLLQALAAAGIDLPAVTSMNVSGQPELADREGGLAFSGAHGLPVFLARPEGEPAVRGSFPILAFGRDGIALVREGHFPGFLFTHLLDRWRVDVIPQRTAKYPLMRTHTAAEARSIPPARLRHEMIAQLDGPRPAA
jgi:hypothetical protein